MESSRKISQPASKLTPQMPERDRSVLHLTSLKQSKMEAFPESEIRTGQRVLTRKIPTSRLLLSDPMVNQLTAQLLTRAMAYSMSNTSPLRKVPIRLLLLLTMILCQVPQFQWMYSPTAMLASVRRVVQVSSPKVLWLANPVLSRSMLLVLEMEMWRLLLPLLILNSMQM